MRTICILIAICALLTVLFLEFQRVNSVHPSQQTAETTMATAAADPGAVKKTGELRVRQPAVAGSFYPMGGERAAAMIHKFLDDAGDVKVAGKVVALIAPHAGYVYSGPVAGYSYKAVLGKQYDTVVVVGPSHYAWYRGAVVPEADAWAGPMATTAIDRKLATELTALEHSIHASDALMAREHSLEVQVPFAHTALGAFKLLPVQIGEADPRTLARIAEALARVLKGKDALLIASTDLSHYPAYDDACRVDAEVLDMVKGWRLADLLAADRDAPNMHVPELHCRMCGVAAVVVVMDAARRLGANQATVLKYANSGDVPEGDRSRCVGYCAVALTKIDGVSPPEVQPIVKESAMTSPSEDQELNRDQQAYVLELAKRAIDEFVIHGRKISPERREGILGEERAVFVTINENGQLRGCIGSLEPQEPLVDAVVSRAIAAATQDPRFRPVERKELPHLDLHVSVLSPTRRVDGPSEIELGRHGIIVKQGLRSGVFLPEVAPEQGWDLETTLNHLCAGKAGLPEDAWKHGAELYVFTTQSIGHEGD